VEVSSKGERQKKMADRKKKIARHGKYFRQKIPKEVKKKIEGGGIAQVFEEGDCGEFVVHDHSKTVRRGNNIEN